MKARNTATCPRAAVALVLLLLALPAAVSVRALLASSSVRPRSHAAHWEDAEQSTLLSAARLDTARCRAACLSQLANSSAADHFIDCHMSQECNLCWQTCELIEANYPVWGNMCQIEDICFTGCEVACAFRGNIPKGASSVAGIFHRAPRVERIGQHFHVTWTRPDAMRTASSSVPLVYILLERQSRSERKWEEIGQTQHLSATLSRHNTPKLWGLRVMAVATSGIWAASRVTELPSLQTSAGGDWAAADEEARQSDVAAEPRVLIPWPPPQLLSLRRSATQGLEAHIAWRSNYDQEALSDQKFELTWRLDDGDIELTGRLYTSETEATFPVLPASTYTVFVRRLDASGGSVAASEVLFLDTSTRETESKLLHSSRDYKFVPGYVPKSCSHLQCDHLRSCRLPCGYNEKVPGLQVAFKEASSPEDGTYFVFDLRSS
ncbi:uncharacterized protein [Dermacentor andersoni]|uniref:uncharacterized protein isoform X2 n=1 Tax=Dermacentor andersoni TaxID=34620 RepID=UPI003B3B5161